MFELSITERAKVVANCSQRSQRSQRRLSKALPSAFTEHTSIQAASVLTSARAMERRHYVERAFGGLKQAGPAYADPAQRLAEMEEKTEALA
ncbi:MAG: hypothetical protein JO006_16695 [Paucibacter sp.]|nr:hypothetical protein [Roseateles sp.]